MTYEEIEDRRDQLNEEYFKAYDSADTDKINKIKEELSDLLDIEMHLEMQNASAIGRNSGNIVFIHDGGEIGFVINTKENGNWDYEDGYTAVDAMKEFTKRARKFNVKTCLVKPCMLDVESLREFDRKRTQYAEEEAYRDACMASAYGDDSLLNRYNRNHGIEKDYGPSNPWDAPGMSIRDFI